MSEISLESLSATSFENLCYDIIRGMAFHNPAWRTPGADGGRDIEAWRDMVDPTFVSTREKWFIECKKYANAIDWPTIHGKIAHAEALDADYLFVMTTSSASPTSIDRITSWNSMNKRPRVRLWGKQDILAHISVRNELSLKYGLGGSSAEAISFQSASLEMAKVISTIHSLSLNCRDLLAALEYANALARCLTERLAQLQVRGSFFSFPRDIPAEDFRSMFDTFGSNRSFSRGELLTIFWVSFVIERRPLHVTISDTQLSARLTSEETQLVLSTPAYKAITFIAGSEVYQNEGKLIIQETQYV